MRIEDARERADARSASKTRVNALMDDDRTLDADGVGAAQMALVPQSSHVPMLSQPEAVAELVANAAASLD